MNCRSQPFSHCERRLIEIEADSTNALSQIAADERLSRAAADVEDALVTRIDDGHYATRIVRIGRDREFQPVVI